MEYKVHPYQLRPVNDLEKFEIEEKRLLVFSLKMRAFFYLNSNNVFDLNTT